MVRIIIFFTWWTNRDLISIINSCYSSQKIQKKMWLCGEFYSYTENSIQTLGSDPWKYPMFDSAIFFGSGFNCSNFRTISLGGIKPHTIKCFLAKVILPIVLEFNSSTTLLTSLKKKYFPGLQIRPVEVNSLASTNSFVFFPDIFPHSALKVGNNNWSSGCAVDANLVQIFSVQCMIIAKLQQAQ